MPNKLQLQKRCPICGIPLIPDDPWASVRPSPGPRISMRLACQFFPILGPSFPCFFPIPLPQPVLQVQELSPQRGGRAWGRGWEPECRCHKLRLGSHCPHACSSPSSADRTPQTSQACPSPVGVQSFDDRPPHCPVLTFLPLPLPPAPCAPGSPSCLQFPKQ